MSILVTGIQRKMATSVNVLRRTLSTPAGRQSLRFASTVPGLMQDHPLNLNQFVWRAEKLFHQKEIISNTVSLLH
jgi:hypothetical protein